MDTDFKDRLLSCADCHGEFIFTAGEQLFFYDKQFKNDPKRCKPCKLRRSGLTAAANGTGPAPAGLSRTETRTECSECGIDTTVPFKPTQGRPVLCRSCFQIKSRTAKPPALSLPGMPLSLGQTAAALSTLSETGDGKSLSADAAVLAATSMAGAASGSCVASAADLASLVNVQPEPREHPVPVQLLSSVENEQAPSVLKFALAESPD